MHALQLRAPLLRIRAIRQYQLSPLPGGLLVRLVLRDAAAARQVLPVARRAIKVELVRVGAAVEALTVEAVDEIRRAGSGAKEQLVGRQ